MKILFITPLAKYTKIRWLPLGLSYISSLLKKDNHTVKLYDRYLKGHFLVAKELVDRDMKSEILRFSPDIIGFSTISPLIYDTVDCVRYIRDFFNGIIIAGGHHATAMPEITLQKIPGLDYVAAGEAEYTMLSLARSEDPLKIAGLFSNSPDCSRPYQAHIKNLDDLPLPDYKIFDMDYYTAANYSTIKGFYLRSACILSSRGCPNKCDFCSESLNFGNSMKFHSADYVVENIQRLVSDYEVEGIYFHDNNFLSSYSHAEAICKKIIRTGLNRKIKWEIQTGTPTVNSEILPLLSEAGCVKIELGIESTRDCDLKSIGKNTNSTLNIKAVELCQKYGIKVHTNFMTGFAGENISDLNDIINWIKKYKPHSFSLHHIQVYPGTRLYEISGDRFFESNEWTASNVNEYYEREYNTGISTQKRKKWLAEIYRPFRKRYNFKSIIRTNSIKKIMKIIYRRYYAREKSKYH